MLVKLNYSSKYFIQNNPHSLFLQESPTKDGLLSFKLPKLTRTDRPYRHWTKQLTTYLFSCAPVSWWLASAPRGFCLIMYSILFGCFSKTFCLVKYTVSSKKFDTQRKLFFPLALLPVLYNFFKTNDSKNNNLYSRS